MNGTPFSAAWNAACSAGQVASLMRIAPDLDRGGEARRRPEFAEADGGGLERLDAAGADQQVGLQARGRQRDQMQAPDAAPDQRARRRHGHARHVARHRQHAAVGDGRQGFVEGAGDHGSSVAQTERRARCTRSPRLRACKRGEVRACGSATASSYDSACFTRSGENGTRRRRTPVASKMALAIAAATGRIDGSPAPVGASSGRLM